ncbi:MAG: hypothetical protein IIB61_07320, partial [Planctomycetes bacterium]|nr:hypothetical protein [Planctomycetota bacterium]
MAHNALLISKAEALPDLPAKVYDIREVEMTAKQSGIYEEVRKHLVLEIEHDMDTSKNLSLTCANVLVKMLRLAQITSGFVTWDAKYTDEGIELQKKRVEQIGDNPKIAALLELLAESGPNDKVLIWACWIEDIRAISAA